jgi:hypothetical protein
MLRLMGKLSDLCIHCFLQSVPWQTDKPPPGLSIPPFLHTVFVGDLSLVFCISHLNDYVKKLRLYTVACRTVAMQRPRDGRMYQGRFWTTPR